MQVGLVVRFPTLTREALIRGWHAAVITLNDGPVVGLHMLMTMLAQSSCTKISLRDSFVFGRVARVEKLCSAMNDSCFNKNKYRPFSFHCGHAVHKCRDSFRVGHHNTSLWVCKHNDRVRQCILCVPIFSIFQEFQNGCPSYWSISFMTTSLSYNIRELFGTVFEFTVVFVFCLYQDCFPLPLMESNRYKFWFELRTWRRLRSLHRSETTTICLEKKGASVKLDLSYEEVRIVRVANEFDHKILLHIGCEMLFDRTRRRLEWFSDTCLAAHPSISKGVETGAKVIYEEEWTWKETNLSVYDDNELTQTHSFWMWFSCWRGRQRFQRNEATRIVLKMIYKVQSIPVCEIHTCVRFRRFSTFHFVDSLNSERKWQAHSVQQFKSGVIQYIFASATDESDMTTIGGMTEFLEHIFKLKIFNDGTNKNRTGCFKMTSYVWTINGKTIGVKCDRQQKKQQQYWRKTSIPRGMMYFVNKEKTKWQEKVKNNIKARTTIEMSLIMIGGLEKEELMETTETEEDLKKKKVDGNVREQTDAAQWRCDVLEKGNKSTPSTDRMKNGKLLKEDRWKDGQLSTSSHELSRNPASWHELNHRENEKRRCWQVETDRRKNRGHGEEILHVRWKKWNQNWWTQKSHEDQNHGKAAATGFHGDTSEQEVERLLGETITEIGMSNKNAKIECLAKIITQPFFYFKDKWKEEQTCQIIKLVEERIEREEDKDIAINGCRRKI